MRRPIRLLLRLFFICAVLLAGCIGRASDPQPVLRLATTTSLYDCGLLDALLPDFEQAYGVRVQVIAVGTGQALKLGADGNADLLLVHAPEQEEAFMAAGHGVRREAVMHDEFVVIGPASDPAGIRGLRDVAAAFRRIAQAQAPFVSRGDESGTHLLEKRIWQNAGIEPQGEWYLSVGQGMGETLTIADEKGAYTLSDRPTYLTRWEKGLRLEILVEGDPLLDNLYSVIVIHPDKGPQIQARLAEEFVDWLLSPPVQERIGAFGRDRFGEPLFFPLHTSP